MTRVSRNLRTGQFAFLIAGALLVGGCAPAGDTDVTGTGGQSASGGATGSGGASSGSGGAVNSSGGAVGSGGARTGGAIGTGGSASGTGGRVGTGGTSTGTGGRVGTGGTSTGTAGSTGSGGAAGGSSGSGFAAVAAMLATNCATATCHQSTDHLDLRNNAGLYARLVGVKPTGTKVMTGCGTVVVAGSPSTSLLSKIVKASVSGCSNARMPDNCSTTSTNPRACLTTAQIAVIDAWITANAPI